MKLFISSSTAQRSSVSKYLVCGESAERGTIAEVESRSEASLPAVGIRAEQTVRLTLSAYGPIRQLLPPLAQPRILDSLAFVDPSGIDDDDKDDDAPVGSVIKSIFSSVVTNMKEKWTRELLIYGRAEEFDGLLKSLQSREWGDKAGPERLSRASRALSRFHSAQLRQMWLILRNNIPTRFVCCTKERRRPERLPVIGEIGEGRALLVYITPVCKCVFRIIFSLS